MSFGIGFFQRDFNPLRPCGRRPWSPDGCGCFGYISIHSARVGGDGIDYGRGNRAANQLELKAEVGAVSAFLSLDRGFHLFYNTNVGKLIDKLPSHIRIMKTGGQNIVGDSGEILYGDSACQINIESSTGAIQLKEEK